MKKFDAEHAASLIKQLKPGFTPKVGIVLGSGLGALAETIEDATVISYQDLPGFPQSTVAGHAGKMVLGYLKKMPVVCLQGRAHYYESLHYAKEVKTYVRTFKLLGCEIFLATNAAGSLRREVGPGNVVAISDHINFQPGNPLVGANDEEFGPRFIGMENLYDSELRAILKQVAAKHKIELEEGVYLAALGPMFETPAEIRAFKLLGADMVGMSTVPEVIVAKHCGLKVVAISAITNLGAGMSDEHLTHEGTLHFAQKCKDKMITLIHGFMEHLSNAG